MPETPESAAPGSGLLDRVVGKAKQVVGSITNNEQLEREGELHDERADARQEAQLLGVDAAEEQEVADLTAREEDLAVEEARLAAEETAEARQDRLDRELAVTEQRLAEEEARRKAAAVQAGRAAEASIEGDGRASRLPEAGLAEAGRSLKRPDQRGSIGHALTQSERRMARRRCVAARSLFQHRMLATTIGARRPAPQDPSPYRT